MSSVLQHVNVFLLFYLYSLALSLSLSVSLSLSLSLFSLPFQMTFTRSFHQYVWCTEVCIALTLHQCINLFSVGFSLSLSLSLHVSKRLHRVQPQFSWVRTNCIYMYRCMIKSRSPPLSLFDFCPLHLSPSPCLIALSLSFFYSTCIKNHHTSKPWNTTVGQSSEDQLHQRHQIGSAHQQICILSTFLDAAKRSHIYVCCPNSIYLIHVHLAHEENILVCNTHTFPTCDAQAQWAL